MRAKNRRHRCGTAFIVIKEHDGCFCLGHRAFSSHYNIKKIKSHPADIADAQFNRQILTQKSFALKKDGTVAVVQGSYSGQSVTFMPDLSKIMTGNGDIPDEPNGYTAIGAIKVATAAATTFTPGTTLLDAVGITATYFDVSVLPESL